MRIRFVNHSSVIIESGGIRLLSDPWLFGAAFNEGWGLLSETVLQPEDFHGITHLWFSHEHPDHFHPPSLRTIPEAARKRITVLFQKTGDRKVIEFCKKQGFADVVELVSGEHYELAPDFKIQCQSWEGFNDSWLYVETPDATVLNVNDCVINTSEDARRVKNQIGPVDVLLTQFSISAWDGNAEDLERRQAGARAMLQRSGMQTRAFEAKHLIPFASYIWFCHEENRYMNEAFLPIEEVHRYLRHETDAQVVFLYPGDEWEVGATHDSGSALKRYAVDQTRLGERAPATSNTVSFDALRVAALGYRDLIGKGGHPEKLRLHLAKMSSNWRRQFREKNSILQLLRLEVEPARIFVRDHARAYLFDIYQGLTPAAFSEQECDVSLGSQSLDYAFRHLWGGEALFVNGRFSERKPGSCATLFHYFSLAGETNAGRPVRWTGLLAKLRGVLGS